VTGTDPEATLLTGSQLEVDVEGENSRDTISFTSYKAVARRGRQSYDRK